MYCASEELLRIQKLKEELGNLVLQKDNLLDPEILRLSKKIDVLLNENIRIPFVAR